jgi:hypothetical protein
MDGYLINGSVGIPRGSMLRIDEGAGVLLYVWEGEVWLTQEGSCRDHVLQPGQWFRLDRGGAALAHAFQRSVVSLSASTPEAPARAVTLLPGGKELPVVLHRSAPPTVRGALRRFFHHEVPPRAAAAN